MAHSTAKITGFVVKEATKGFMNDRLFSGLVSHKYESEFQERGAKKGDTIQVRRTAQFRVRTGAGMEIQDIHEDVKTVKLGEQKGVDFQFSDKELTLDIDNGGTEYSQRFIRPAGSALASDFDAKGMKVAALEAGHAVVLEANATAEAKYQGFLKAKSLLNKSLAPKTIGARNSVIGSDVENDLSFYVKNLYNNERAITKAIKEGTIQDVAGLTWAASDLAYVHVNGAGGATVTIASVTPDYDNMTQWVAYTISSGTLNVGDTIQFTGVYAINAETKAQYANKLQRKILDLKTESNTKYMLVYSLRPVLAENAVNSAETRKKFAMANCTAIGSNATANVLGVAGTSYLCCPVFHKDAIVQTCVDLVKPSKVERCDSVNYKDIVIRYVRDYSISNDVMADRLDILGEFTTMIPEWLVSVEIPL